VAQVCHLKLQERLRSRGSRFQDSLGKTKFGRSHLNRKGWVWLCMPIISAIVGSIDGRIIVQLAWGKKRDLISK
jgi:hypothetical protein